MQPNADPSASPLATLRQLKELLDAGAITPAEFETLKRQLIFDGNAAAAAPGSGGVGAPVAPTLPAATPEPVPASVPPAAPLPQTETAGVLPAGPASAAAPATEAAAVASALEAGGAAALGDANAGRPGGAFVETAPLVSSSPRATAPTAGHAPLPPTGPAPNLATDRRNPLTLVFAIGGGVLVLLLVLYLALGNRTPDEHLTSGSLTPADTAAAKPEEGPQAEQITLPPVAAPETVRLAPVAAPAPPPAAASTFTDSTAVPAARPTAPAAAPAATPAPAGATDSTATATP